MTLSPAILKTILLSAIFATSLQSQSYAADKSKYFGAKLIELDTLIDQSNHKSVQFVVTNSLRGIGRVFIQRGRTPLTAVEFATAKSKPYAEAGTLVSKPTSGWFTNNDSTYCAITDSDGAKICIYARVMKADLDCYWIVGSMSEENWKTNGEALRSLIDSFKFN